MDQAGSHVASGSYPRSTGSARGQARQQELLDAVTNDLAANGLADFSLRRAARAAGTTHKVLLYHFDGIEDLLEQALLRLRQRRITTALAATGSPGHERLADRVRAIWPVLSKDESGLRVIDQAIGLAMYDPQRYAHLASQAVEQYMAPLAAILPAEWAQRRKDEVASLLLAIFRGFLMDWQTSRDPDRIERALVALTRALDREEAAPE